MSDSRPRQKWKVRDLKVNPHQADLFDEMPDGQLDELAADIKVNGQRDPIEIIPDGTIIDGHQRRRAAEKLGWEEVDVIVREDLADAGDAAVEEHMISVNLNRRQMDILAVARLYRRLKEIERGWGHNGFSHAGRVDLRDRLAQRLGGKSGRTLDRYVKLLDTPREVQQAFSRQQLTMQQALKVLRLGREDQAAIAKAIRAGRPAKNVIDSYFSEASSERTATSRVSNATSQPPVVCRAPLDSESDLNQEEDVPDEIQLPLESFQGAFASLLESDLPLGRKILAIEEATLLFQESLLLYEEAGRRDGAGDVIGDQVEP